MKIYLLFLILVPLVLGLPPARSTNCIPTCTCNDILPNFLNVVGCSSPLYVNSTLFNQINRRAVTVVSFSNVIIDEISEDAFKQFPNLEDVVMDHVRIGSIDEKALDNVKKAKFVNCNFEDIPSLSSEKLEELHFGSCGLDQVPDLQKLFSLKFLNLSDNSLSDINIVTFAELFDLEDLHLSNNEISRIPANIFVNNEALHSLYLDNNPLKIFYLNTSNRIETLSLKNCFLSTFDENSSSRLTSLSALYLANNQIKNLAGKDFAFMEQLEIIDLSNNDLQKLDDDIFSKNKKLEKVTLDGNKFETLPNFTLADQQNFEIYYFSCKNCGLKTVHPNTFKHMPAIVNLLLSDNKFTFIQDMFKYIKSLLILDISNNELEILTGAFDDNRNLEHLIISGNPLLSINPENFVNNHALKKIVANDCKIRKLWSNNATVLTSVQKLFLSDNQLTGLTKADLKIVPNLQSIGLDNNPFVFDENFCQVIGLLQNSSIYLITKDKSEIDVIDQIDQFLPNGWTQMKNNKCSEVFNLVDSDESVGNDGELEDDSGEIEILHKSSHILKNNAKDLDDDDSDDLSYSDDYDDSLDDGTYYDDDSRQIDDDMEDDEENDVGVKATAEIVAGENINLERLSYILSVTSVFVLTALAVLIMAVVITLCVLRRNNNFNMQKANLPRLKIPLWDTQYNEKKLRPSSSIYKPLSEDLSGPKTPKMSRYDFTAAPTVHTSNP